MSSGVGVNTQDLIGPLVGQVRIELREKVKSGGEDGGEDGGSEQGQEIVHEFLLPPVTFRDWATVQNTLMDEWRERRIGLVTKLKGTVPPDEYAEMRREAFREATNLTAFSQDQIMSVVFSDVGVGTILWVLAERKYPKKISREKCIELVATNRVEQSSIDSLAVQVNQLLGVTGNSIGQVSE